MRVGIDASSIVDGGGLTHLQELINNFCEKESSNITQLVLISSEKCLKRIPDQLYLKKKTFWWLNKTKFHRIIFQLFLFDIYLKNDYDIIFSVTGDYVGNFKPLVAMSQNMLLYERELWKNIKSVKEKFKFFFNYKRQKKCFENANGLIFLSKYAKNYVSNKLFLENKNSKIVHHGISKKFINQKKILNFSNKYSLDNPFKFLYVSTVHVYKHQWNVVEAIHSLRENGYPVALTLIGNIIYKPSGQRLKKAMRKFDLKKEFVSHILNVPYSKINQEYFNHDGIIFASTCENMPNILIESMASGLPIACSDKKPMPEFLKDGGFYFDSNKPSSIVGALKKILLCKKEDLIRIRNKNIKEIEQYDWKKTSKETMSFILEVYNKNPY